MRLPLLLGLALVSHGPLAAEQADIQNQDLQAVREVLRKKDPSLDWFRALAKEPIDENYSVILVEAAPTELRSGASRRSPVVPLTQIAALVVHGKANQVQLVLETLPASNLVPVVKLDQPIPHAAYLHFYSDYGMYHGSVKYIYDLPSRKPPLKYRYGILALTSATRVNGTLRYAASFRPAGQPQEGWIERHAKITIEPRGDDRLPGHKIEDAPAPVQSAMEPNPLRTASGDKVLIVNTTPSRQSPPPSGINVISRTGSKRFFPVPIPAMGTQNEIGPFVIDGTKIWFANTFYDSEGQFGVGAVGSFDIPTRKYEMRYLPEIAPWSGSAIMLDGEELWVGLMRRPEGAKYGGGLLRYHRATGAVTKYAVPDLIYSIDRLGDTLYCGTAHGLYRLRGNRLTQLRFEPDIGRKLVLVAREVR